MYHFKYKTMLNLFTFLLGIGANSEIFAYDAVMCKWDFLTYRQLCEVDSSEKKVEVSIEATNSFQGYRKEIAESIEKQRLILETQDGPVDLVLDGLQVLLELETNFTNLDACRQSILWQDRLAIFIRLPNGTERLVSEVVVGSKSHRIKLSTDPQSRDYSLSVSNTPESQTVSYVGSFFIRNLDHPNGNGSIRRIPPQCILSVTNQRLTFDAEAINANLSSLRFNLFQTDKAILKETILNGLYLDKQIGAVCAIEKLAKTLYLVEGLSASETPANLTLTSQMAISDAISLAVSFGSISSEAIPKDTSNLPDYFAYYLNAENRSQLEQTCSQIVDNLHVRKESFVVNGVITNEAAYKNAEDFASDLNNLRNMIDAAWALVAASKKDVEDSKELSWLIDPKIYGYSVDQ